MEREGFHGAGQRQFRVQSRRQRHRLWSVHILREGDDIGLLGRDQAVRDTKNLEMRTRQALVRNSTGPGPFLMRPAAATAWSSWRREPALSVPVSSRQRRPGLKKRRLSRQNRSRPRRTSRQRSPRGSRKIRHLSKRTTSRRERARSVSPSWCRRRPGAKKSSHGTKNRSPPQRTR